MESVDPPIQDPDGGLFILAAKATSIGSGWWSYEYALYNMNSERSAGTFSVPLPTDEGFQIQNIGFHDVNYHSGEEEIYDGTDWLPAIVTTASITWATTPFATDQNTNALRWGTLYNFRFQANRPPVYDETVTIGLFKPPQGNLTPVSVTPAASPVGACCVPDACTVETQTSCACQGGTFLGAGSTCTEPDCNCNTIPDSCDIASGTSQDSNQNGVPDECEGGAVCCLSDGSCVASPERCCAQAGGTFLSPETSCGTTYRACCRPPPYEDCIVTTRPCCEAVGGRFKELKLTCGVATCPAYNGPALEP